MNQFEDIDQQIERVAAEEAVALSDRHLLEHIYCMLRTNIIRQRAAANAANLEKLGFVADTPRPVEEK